jgi:hypothetical protein
MKEEKSLIADFQRLHGEQAVCAPCDYKCNAFSVTFFITLRKRNKQKQK